jgi:hypothetical protein
MKLLFPTPGNSCNADSDGVSGMRQEPLKELLRNPKCLFELLSTNVIARESRVRFPARIPASSSSGSHVLVAR